MLFLDRVIEYGDSHTDSVALRYAGTAQHMTYGELNMFARRVCTFLRSKGLGRDDFIMIRMDRGVTPIACMIGVWMAGCACVVNETVMPESRSHEIYTDCDCKYLLTEASLAEINGCMPSDSYRKANPHDAAFAVYTSGSTGAPKGIIHEYGKFDLIMDVDSSQNYDHTNQVFGLIAPLSTIVSILLIVPLLSNAAELDLIPYDAVRDPRKLVSLIEQDHIRMMFMPPSYFQMFPTLPKQLSTIFVGSEPADRVYREGIQIFNSYALSESGFTVLYHIARPGETNVPIGRSPISLQAFPADENGIETTEGELVLEVPYTRGYIHPEVNPHSFRNGFLYTGDIVRKDENGDLVYLGRRDEMIKIHGRRIEPAEIERAVRRVLGISMCAAKGFADTPTPCVCVYYTDHIEIKAEDARNRLRVVLPDYMIPQHYIHMDQLPKLASGKIDRKSLPRPDLSASHNSYSEPATALEKLLCETFANVLHLEKVGAEDDFFDLGGDSLSAMDLMVRIEAIDSVVQLLTERTPRALAKALENSNTHRDRSQLDQQLRIAMSNSHPLTAMQRYIMKYQFTAMNTTMWNLPLLVRFDSKRISPKRMQKLVERMLAAHPALQTTITINRNGTLQQEWTPELMAPTEIIYVSDSEFESIRDTLVRPFELFNSPLQRNCIYVSESAAYLFWDFHHAIIDGYSMRNLRRDFINLLNGEDIPTDYYYLNIAEEEKYYDTEQYREAALYYNEHYNITDAPRYPTPDFDRSTNIRGTADHIVRFAPGKEEDMCTHYRSTITELCIAAFMIAVSNNTKSYDVQCAWLYHGRNDRLRSDSVGLFFRTMPICMSFKPGMPIMDILKSIRDQFRHSVAYNEYPYALDMFDGMQDDRASCFYQDDIYDASPLEDYGITFESPANTRGASCCVLDISISPFNGGLKLHADFAGNLYKQKTIDRFLQTMGNILKHFADFKPETLQIGW